MKGYRIHNHRAYIMILSHDLPKQCYIDFNRTNKEHHYKRSVKLITQNKESFV